MKFQFLVWGNATVEDNFIHGVVEIHEHELAELIADKVREKGFKVAHVELRNIDNGGLVSHNYVIIDITKT